MTLHSVTFYYCTLRLEYFNLLLHVYVQYIVITYLFSSIPEEFSTLELSGQCHLSLIDGSEVMVTIHADIHDEQVHKVSLYISLSLNYIVVYLTLFPINFAITT